MNDQQPLEAVVLCVDGSEAAERAVAEGSALLRNAARVLLVTVAEEVDPELVTGTGFAGGVITDDEYEELDRQSAGAGWATLEDAIGRLHIDGIEPHVLRGEPGPALCAYAAKLPARVVVMGSRGRGGVKRALLGSVSDYVTRNATCPVVVVGPEA